MEALSSGGGMPLMFHVKVLNTSHSKAEDCEVELVNSMEILSGLTK